MTHTNPFRNWSGLKGKRNQSGQAVVYGLFILVAGLASLFFFFNTGQLTHEKTKLVNTADAVAYSAGVMHARALNFHAYANRALMANEVLIAQMVSLSSWGQYAEKYAENVVNAFPECVDAQGAAVGSLLNYGVEYGVLCALTSQYASSHISHLASLVSPTTQFVVSRAENYKRMLQGATVAMHEELVTARNELMKEVAQQNYVNDGEVQVISGSSASTLLSTIGVNPLDDWHGFTKRYKDDERGRMAEVAKTAAYTDPFIKERSWTSRAPLPGPDWKCIFLNKKNEVRRRGGTELIGFDEWKAMDTQASIRWQNAGKPWQIRCEESEISIGNGEQEARQSGSDPDDSEAGLGGTRRDTPQTAAQAESSSQDFFEYSGIPSFYDLNTSVLNNEDSSKRNNPSLKFKVVLQRKRNQLSTSDERSQVASSPTFNNYQSKMAGEFMRAISTSEVYFERSSDVQPNTFGSRQGRPREIGSLFNPYWQVKLTP